MLLMLNWLHFLWSYWLPKILLLPYTCDGIKDTVLTASKKPKDKIKKEASRGIVYKIKCKDCDCVYIGQTSCTLKTCVKEHAKAVATLDENSLLAKHHMRHSHQIDLASVKIVDRSSAWWQRLILEAWHSVRDRNAINEHIALPNVYNSIKNLQK